MPLSIGFQRIQNFGQAFKSSVCNRVLLRRSVRSCFNLVCLAWVRMYRIVRHIIRERENKKLPIHKNSGKLWVIFLLLILPYKDKLFEKFKQYPLFIYFL